MATEYFTVADVQPRTVTTKFGVKNVYDVLSTAGQKYGAGFKDPKLAPGQHVQAEVVVGKYGPDIQTMMVIPALPGGMLAGAAAAASMAPIGIAPLPMAPVAIPQFANVPSTPAAPQARDPHHFTFGAHAFPLPPTHGARTFVRRDALTAAITFAMPQGKLGAADVIEIARHFEAYIAGDDALLAIEEIESNQQAAEQAKPSAAVSIAEAVKRAKEHAAARS